MELPYFAADRLCRFLGGRPPTWQEWEAGATGLESYHFPWGDEVDLEVLTFEDMPWKVFSSHIGFPSASSVQSGAVFPVLPTLKVVLSVCLASLIMCVSVCCLCLSEFGFLSLFCVWVSIFVLTTCCLSLCGCIRARVPGTCRRIRDFGWFGPKPSPFGLAELLRFGAEWNSGAGDTPFAAHRNGTDYVVRSLVVRTN